MVCIEVNIAQVQIDSDLVGRCLKGDQNAWNDLVLRYERLIYSIARVLCPRPEDVSDVFQQVWLELYQQLGDLKNVGALPAWLITVTRRRSFAVLRERYASEPLGKDIPDVSAHLAQIEREHSLERALDQVSERCRRLIDLLYLDSNEPSYAQVSDVMRIPVASIGPTRARCLEKLRKLLS